MKPKVSRMEGNKEVRRVLARHGTDLSHLSYSCSGSEVRLTGSLIKTDGSDFSVQQVETLVQEFTRHLNGFAIHGDMDNWNFTQDHITYLGSGGGSGEAHSQNSHEEEEEVA